MDRKEKIREAAKRKLHYADNPKEGRWMRLESAVREEHHHKRRPAAGGYRRFQARKRSVSSWVVLYPGTPAIGARILIRLAPPNDGVMGRYVQSIITPADRRSDGKSVLAVSKSPVMPPRPATASSVAAPPSPKPPPALTQRNPRICEDCEGPCRPGAGVCDTCKSV